MSVLTCAHRVESTLAKLPGVPGGCERLGTRVAAIDAGALSCRAGQAVRRAGYRADLCTDDGRAIVIRTPRSTAADPAPDRRRAVCPWPICR